MQRHLHALGRSANVLYGLHEVHVRAHRAREQHDAEHRRDAREEGAAEREPPRHFLVAAAVLLCRVPVVVPRVRVRAVVVAGVRVHRQHAPVVVPGVVVVVAWEIE